MIKVEMKVCIRCKIPKALCEFTRNRNEPDGLSSYCRKCSRKINAGYRGKSLVKNIKSYSASTLMDKVKKRLRKYAIRNDKGRRITIKIFKESLLQPEWRDDKIIYLMVKEIREKHHIRFWQEGDVVLIDNRE